MKDYEVGVAKFKWGVVSDRRADPKGPLVRVRWDDLEGMESHWLRVGQRKTLNDKHYYLPDVGEHVACILDEFCEDGCVVAAIYSDDDLPPTTNPDVEMVQFSDGTVVAYDRAAHAFTINCVGAVTVVAESATVHAPTITLDGDATCTGSLTVDGPLKVCSGVNVIGAVLASGAITPFSPVSP